MGTITPTKPNKLFLGALAAGREQLDKALEHAAATWGPIDTRSECVPFHFTAYYGDEMGPDLLRQWVSFQDLVMPDTLSAIKRKTNSIEADFAVNTKRRVNLDPGYIDLSKIVLASTKDFSHRIYLADGIYAEVTLLYKAKEYTFLPWTYPDYKSETALRFFSRARAVYKKQIGL